MNTTKVYKDGFGGVYSSIEKMCDAHNLSVPCYCYRIAKKEMTVQEALTAEKTFIATPVECYDHLGNYFPSISRMCKFWGVSVKSYWRRVHDGWTKEAALTTPVGWANSVVDPDGRVFKNIDSMCKAYGVSTGSYTYRISIGMTPREALSRYMIDHAGHYFESVEEMVDYWNVSKSAFYSRIHNGYSLEEALTGKCKLKDVWIIVTHYPDNTVKYTRIKGKKEKIKVEMLRLMNEDCEFFFKSKFRFGPYSTKLIKEKGYVLTSEVSLDKATVKYSAMKETAYIDRGPSEIPSRIRVKAPKIIPAWEYLDALAKQEGFLSYRDMVNNGHIIDGYDEITTLIQEHDATHF